MYKYISRNDWNKSCDFNTNTLILRVVYSLVLETDLQDPNVWYDQVHAREIKVFT
jgi:hypothetical protein